MDQVIICSALKTFGNIIRDRNRRSLDLILKIADTAEICFCSKLEDSESELDRGIPNGKIFEVFIFHH